MTRLIELRTRFGQEPLGRLLQARLEVLEDGRAVVAAPAGPELMIVDGVAQGGVITAVADYAAVYAAMTRVPAGCMPAVQISVNFLRPIGAGETMRAEARVVSDSRSQVVTSVEVRGDDGKLKAVATILFAKPSR